MPISSGAGGRIKAARVNRGNLKRSPNWSSDELSAPNQTSRSGSVDELSRFASGALRASEDKHQRQQQLKRRQARERSDTSSRSRSKGGTSGARLSRTNPLEDEDAERPSSRPISGDQRPASGSQLASGATRDERQAISIAGETGARRAQTIRSAATSSSPASVADEPLKPGRLKRIMNSLGGQRVLTGGGGGLQSTSATSKRSSSNELAASATPKGNNGAKTNTMGQQPYQQPSQATTTGATGTQSGKQSGGLFGSLLSASSEAAIDTNPTAASGADPAGKRARMLAGKTYMINNNNSNSNKSALNYHLNAASSAKSSLQNSQASLLNQSMSLLGAAGQATAKGGGGGNLSAGSTATTSAANSLANLHNLHNQHHHQHHLQHHHNHQHHSTHSHQHHPNGPLNISKRVNLKYVKSLIVLLMSLDLLITLFVHHFASHDELAVVFTSHKLRFSLLNLILSSVWFVVLSGAIIFDIYPILLIGCLVDFASFILLLVCTVIHFMHRIDYNTVNLTSLLLLLFSIIVLHVYLLVIAALTTYLMLAVKRRQKIRS